MKDTIPFAKQIHNSPYLAFEGIFTHFADTDNSDGAFTHLQGSRFVNIIQELEWLGLRPPIVHAANSAATLNYPEYHFDMVRVGIAGFGLNPFPPGHQRYAEISSLLRPILTLKTSIIYISEITANEAVGYGLTWRTSHTTKLALLPIGYGDGFCRAPQSQRTVLIRGIRCSIVGRISMDQTTVDVSHVCEVVVGDEVILIGTQNSFTITAEDVAIEWGTIPYEVTTSLSSRITRCYT
jgi:alanine racemase